MPSAKKSKSQSQRKASVSRSSRAGVFFSVGRLATQLRKGHYTKRIGESAPVFLAAVLDYLCGEILTQGNVSRLSKTQIQQRIKPENIFEGIQEDSELKELFNNAIIRKGGNKQHIEPFIEASMKRKGKSRSNSQSKSQNQSQVV